jgi:cytochrome c oxidase subunit 3
MFLKKYSKYLNHPYHIVDASPWPFIIGMALLCLMGLNAVILSFGITNFLSFYFFRVFYKISFFVFIISIFLWWYDMINESVIQGHYTKKVQQNLSIGMILFIISEVMFFFGFFWAYFHFSLNPTDSIQGHWPPLSIDVIPAFGLPLINTFILLSSGITLTYSHYALYNKNKDESCLGLGLTIILGLIFSGIQYMEFYLANFTIADSVYGSVFYMLTGLHGFHVIIGTLFLIVSFIRLIFNYFNMVRFSGFELAIWYWHFVDIVWLFVFICVYWWGNL